MPRSILHQHRSLIIRKLEKKATNQEILDALLATSVNTSLEAVRDWVNKNAPAHLLKGRGKGRPKKTKLVRFDFLVDHQDKMELPPFLETSLELLLCRRPDGRSNAKLCLAEALLRSAKIPIDVTIPPPEWILPAKALKEISDLELMLLTYALSDHHSDPPTHGTHAYRTWLLGLMRDAAAMRAKIKRGINFTLSEIT